MQSDRITLNPDICNGKPTIRGLRVTVATIIEYLAQGESRENILSEHPFLEPKDIDASLIFASKLMENHYEVYKVA